MENFESKHTYSDQSGHYDYTVTRNEDGSLIYRVEHDGYTTVAVMRPTADQTVGGDFIDYLMVDEKLALGDGTAMYGGTVYVLDWWTPPTL